MTWRVGRTLGRTLYRDEQCVGMVDTPELAAEIVKALDEWAKLNEAVVAAAETAIIAVSQRDLAVAEGHRIGAYWATRLMELVDPLKHENRELKAKVAELEVTIEWLGRVPR